jgi:hypothetical protein
MRRKTSYADFLTDWQHLLATVNAIPELSGSRHKANLENLMSQIALLTTRQAQLQAAKQTASLDLKQLIVNGKDVERDLTAAMKAHFGSRSEELVQFRVAPLRQSRKAKPGGSETPPSNGGSTPEASTPAPVSGTQPITQG